MPGEWNGYTHYREGKEGGKEGVEYKSGRSGLSRPPVPPKFGIVILIQKEAEVDFRKHRILLHFPLRGFGWTIWRGRRMET